MIALGKFNESTGYNWKSKVEAKARKFSRTPGKQKGLTCQANTLERHMAKCSRSYKHKLYPVWLAKTRQSANV